MFAPELTRLRGTCRPLVRTERDSELRRVGCRQLPISGAIAYRLSLFERFRADGSSRLDRFSHRPGVHRYRCLIGLGQPQRCALGGAGRNSARRRTRGVSPARAPSDRDRAACPARVAAGGGRAVTLPDAVALGTPWSIWSAVHSGGDGRGAIDPGPADRRGTHSYGRQRPLGRIRWSLAGRRRQPAARHPAPAAGCTPPPPDRGACRVRSNNLRGWRDPDRRRQYRRLHPNHDDGDRA